MWGRKKKYKFDRMSLIVSPSSTGVGYMVNLVDKHGMVLNKCGLHQNDWDSVMNMGGTIPSNRFGVVGVLMRYVERKRDKT